MKERPILFKAEMVRAILAGTKTQTRRVIDMSRLKIRLRHDLRSDIPFDNVNAKAGGHPARMNQPGAVAIVMPDGTTLGVKPGEFDFICPYSDGETRLVNLGVRSEWMIAPTESRLWVREAWAIGKGYDGASPSEIEFTAAPYIKIWYMADGPKPEWAGRYRHARFMPRAICRILLDVEDVRLPRLRDISEGDAMAEGCAPTFTDHLGNERESVGEFEMLWDSINGKTYPWDSNPCVWAITFKVVR